MSNENIGDTSPIRVQPDPDTEPQPRKPKRWLTVLLGIAAMLVLGAIGSFVGYSFAVQDRIRLENEQVAILATEQYQLGIIDMEFQRWNSARQRFEYVIEIDPDFPGVMEKLTEVMMKSAVVITPTTAPTPTPQMTATPDLRGAEELFNVAWQYYVAKDWVSTLITLDALRQEDIGYRALDVNGMYYIALRGRGINQIAAGNLEEGIYDLSLSETFAPLDREAEGYRSSARHYLTGASFWEVDWQRVVTYFADIYASLPNLRDGDGWTALERFRYASVKYGDQLLATGEYCQARDQYNTALSISVDDQLAPTATAVQLICQPPTVEAPTPTMTLETIIIETTEVVPPVEESTPTPTLTLESPGG